MEDVVVSVEQGMSDLGDIYPFLEPEARKRILIAVQRFTSLARDIEVENLRVALAAEPERNLDGSLN